MGRKANRKWLRRVVRWLRRVVRWRFADVRERLRLERIFGSRSEFTRARDRV